MPSIAVNGIALAYEETGSGDPLILLHGAVQARDVWRAQVPVLARRFRVVAYDLRGHGESGLGKESMTIGLLTDDLLALMDALRIERAVLCGVSLGGMVALHAAERAPERVRAMVLANSPMALSLSSRLLTLIDWLNPYLVLVPALVTLGQERAGRIGIGLAKTMLGRGWVSETAERRFIAGFSSMSRQAVLETYRAICEARVPPLEKVSCPTLIVTGKHETGMIFRHAAEIARRIGRVELATVPGGHVTNLDAPDAFNAAVMGFVDRWLQDESSAKAAAASIRPS